LKDFRLAAGLTQEALAERAGLSARAISDLERGVSHLPRQDTLDLLVQALALSPRRRALLIAAAHPLLEPADALDPSAHPPQNLPVPPTPLIGREREVTRAATLLSRADVRLLTITGPSGVGKTRLGLQVAEDLLDRFEDGVWVVELAPIRDAALVGATIAQTLGLHTSFGQSPQELVKAALGKQRTLLVLDNFEQVALAAPLLADLLSCCPRLKLLVTSRAALRVRGEYELAVAPLEQEAAITLFLQRAQAVQPDLAFTVETILAASAICQRLDGLPLALELAAAHVKALGLSLLLERLSSRLVLLKGGALDLPERQRTMRDAIAWSYDLLSQPVQRLFHRLAVFVGGCTLEAAEAICGEEAEGHPGAVLEGIECLIDTSLLRAEALAEPRFNMLETIRDYALERLHASDEAETLARLHLMYYLHLAEEAARIGPAQDQRDARLGREVTNVRAALAWVRGRQESELGLRLVYACGRIWYYRGMAGELVQWFEHLLALDDTAGACAASPTVRVHALYGIAAMLLEQGQYARVERLAREGLALAERIGDLSGMGNALSLLGNVAQARGDLPEAIRLFERGLACCREAGDRGGVGMTLISLGHLARTQGDYARATQLLEEALADTRAINLTWGVANILTGLALVAREQGDYSRALALYRESLGIHQGFSNRTYLAWDFEGLAAVIGALGDPARATQLCAVAERFRQTMRTPRPPAEQEDYDHTLAAARDALGQEEFEHVWFIGTALTPEAAMTLASSSNAP
jgi:predicted ATPase/DNA-binding XRE family transcriptional regulator